MKRAMGWGFALLMVGFGCGHLRTVTFAEVPASSYTAANFRLNTGGSVTSVPGASVTTEFFNSAKVRLLLGRFPLQADNSSMPVVVLSHALWLRDFGSSPDVIGRQVEIDARKTTVIGVAPPGFQFPKGAQLWTPREP